MSDIQNLIEALDRNTEALKASAAHRTEVLAAAEKVTEANPKPKAAAKADAPKADEKPAADEGAVDKVAEVVNRYMEGTSGAEREARKAEIGKVFAHPKVGAKKRSEIPANMESAVIKAVETLIKNGNVLPADEPDADEGDGDDLLG